MNVGALKNRKEVTHPLGRKLKDRLVEINGSRFLLAGELNSKENRPIYVSQKDVQELQLAKGAIATGIRILMQNYGLTVDDITEVQLAGFR